MARSKDLEQEIAFRTFECEEELAGKKKGSALAGSFISRKRLLEIIWRQRRNRRKRRMMKTWLPSAMFMVKSPIFERLSGDGRLAAARKSSGEKLAIEMENHQERLASEKITFKNPTMPKITRRR